MESIKSSKRPEGISSGIQQLDELLGGIFIGDNVVWYDDAGSLAHTFSFQFIKTSLSDGHPLIYVSFDRSPKSLLKAFGSLAQNQNLTILDCFTHGKGDGSAIFREFYEKDGAQWPYQIIQLNEPWKPEKVMDAIYNLHKTMKGTVRYIFESLTGMQNLWGGEEKIMKFYTHSCPRLYELDTIAYWIIENAAHSKRLKAQINQVAQVAIKLTARRGKSALTILKADKRNPETLNKPNSFWRDGETVRFESTGEERCRLELGRRLKELRTRKGMAQKDLAALVKLTPSTISQIESNIIFPSLHALIRIAETLSVDIGAFFPPKGTPTNQVLFSSSDLEVNFPNTPRDAIKGNLLCPIDFEAKATPFRIEISPKSKLTSHFFLHKGEEFGYLISGELQVVVRNTLHTMKPGNLIYLTSDFPTSWENPGSLPAVLFWVKVQ